MPTVTRSLGEGTQSVLLTVEILERLAQAQSAIGISDLSRSIGTSKSRIYRHLQTLQSCGVLARDEAGRYEIGERLFDLCRLVNQRFDIVGLAEPVMAQLRRRWGHTVIISEIEGAGVRVLSSISGGSPIVLDILPGTILPLARSAQGKVAMAFMSEGTEEFDAARRAFTEAAPDELQRILAEGWAEAQMREGLKGLAAPVLDGSGRPLATLALLDTASDIGDPPDPEKTADLIATAQDLGRTIRSGPF